MRRIRPPGQDRRRSCEFEGSMGRFVGPDTSRGMTAPKRRNGLLKGGAMSEELRGSHYGANDEPGDEVEAHGSHYGQNDEAGDEVEGHGNRAGLNDESGDEVEGHGNRAGLTDESDDDEVEGHGNRAG